MRANPQPPGGTQQNWFSFAIRNGRKKILKRTDRKKVCAIRLKKWKNLVLDVWHKNTRHVLNLLLRKSTHFRVNFRKFPSKSVILTDQKLIKVILNFEYFWKISILIRFRWQKNASFELWHKLVWIHLCEMDQLWSQQSYDRNQKNESFCSVANFS